MEVTWLSEVTVGGMVEVEQETGLSGVGGTVLAGVERGGSGNSSSESTSITTTCCFFLGR